MEPWRSFADPGRAFLVFVLAVALTHTVPALVPHGDFVDLATPFVVVGAAVLVLRALATRGAPLAVAVLSGIFYVSGQGIHLAANSIATEEPVGRVARVADFWDEHLGHIWWHLGWLGLLLAFSLAAHTTPPRVRLAGPAPAPPPPPLPLPPLPPTGPGRAAGAR